MRRRKTSVDRDRDYEQMIVEVVTGPPLNIATPLVAPLTAIRAAAASKWSLDSLARMAAAADVIFDALGNLVAEQ